MSAKHLPLVLALFFIGCASRATQQAATDQALASHAQPNILFIFADDWGFGDLGSHGHPHIQTPHLDRLASQGTDFHQFTVASGVCSPSRAAILTGHFPARYNINQHFASIAHHQRANMPDWLDPEAPMLPRMLQAEGYNTYHFGKWHLTNRNITDAPDPKRYGYDDAAVFNGPGEQVTHDGLFDRAIQVINNKADKPFFINLWIHETHVPHYPKDAMLEKYAHLDKPQQVYAAVVTEADRQIGRVLKALDDAGIADNTLVIFTSDNGPENTGKRETINDASTGPGLGTVYSVGTTGGLRGRKRSLYEGGVRVPLIVRWPGQVTAGYDNRNIVMTGVDWLPTLCAIAGAELPVGYEPDGEDRRTVLLNKRLHDPSLRVRINTSRQKPIFWSWPGNHKGNNWPEAAIRQGKWKLVIGDDGKTNQLYDIPADRAEANNLADQHPDVVAALRKQLDAWLAELPDRPDPKCFSRLRQP